MEGRMSPGLSGMPWTNKLDRVQNDAVNTLEMKSRNTGLQRSTGVIN